MQLTHHQIYGLKKGPVENTAARLPMNRFQAMAQIMAMLNKDGSLKPGTKLYKTVREMVTDKIDRLGPEAAAKEVQAKKAHFLHQIKILNMYYKHPERFPPDTDL
ncbi:MAG: hypothetical protein PVG51_17840 [Desulfosarcina sp.]|jgi:hypothetical protein